MKRLGICFGISGLLLGAACSSDPAPATGGSAGSGGSAATTAGNSAGGSASGSPGAGTGGMVTAGSAGKGGGGGAGGGGTAGAAGTAGAGGTAGTAGTGGAGGAGACETKLGKAIKFAGAPVVDMLAGDLGADTTFGDTARTIELWAKFAGASSWTAEQSIIELGKPAGADHVWGIDMSGRNGAAGVFGPYTNGVSDNNGTNAPPQFPSAVDVGWLHLSWSYKGAGGDLVFTVNGDVLPTQVPAPGFSLKTSPGYVLLGASQNFGNGGWDGTMDEVRIWNVYRTPAEIKANMKVVQKANAAGLVAYYRFSEGTGTFTDDESKKATHRLSACAAAGGACPAANGAAPTWVDSDIPGPFTCAP